MNFDQFKAILIAMSWKEAVTLADTARVPRSTVLKIRKGPTSSPRIGTVEKLISALEYRHA